MKPPQKCGLLFTAIKKLPMLWCVSAKVTSYLSLFLVVYARISSNFVMADLRYLHKEHCLSSSQAGKSSRQTGNIFSLFQSKTTHPVVFSRKKTTHFLAGLRCLSSYPHGGSPTWRYLQWSSRYGWSQNTESHGNLRISNFMKPAYVKSWWLHPKT